MTDLYIAVLICVPAIPAFFLGWQMNEHQHLKELLAENERRIQNMEDE